MSIPTGRQLRIDPALPSPPSPSPESAPGRARLSLTDPTGAARRVLPGAAGPSQRREGPGDAGKGPPQPDGPDRRGAAAETQTAQRFGSASLSFMFTYIVYSAHVRSRSSLLNDIDPVYMSNSRSV